MAIDPCDRITWLGECEGSGVTAVGCRITSLLRGESKRQRKGPACSREGLACSHTCYYPFVPQYRVCTNATAGVKPQMANVMVTGVHGRGCHLAVSKLEAVS